MNKFLDPRRILLAFLACLIPRIASAACIETTAPASLPGGVEVPFKTYRCSIEEDREVKLTFHRLSSLSASMLTEGKSSVGFAAVLGGAVALPNRVLDLYKSLAARYAESEDVRYIYLRLVAAGNEGQIEVSEDLTGTVLRPIGGSGYGGKEALPVPYPAANETRALTSRSIPKNLSICGLEAETEDLFEGDVSNFPGLSIRGSKTTPIVWRSLTAADAEGYSNNVAAFNDLYEGRKPRDYELQFTPPPDPYLRMLSDIVPSAWPDDLAILRGLHEKSDGCGGSATFDNWVFQYSERIPILDIVVVENASEVPVALDGLLGDWSSDSSFRPSGEGGRKPRTGAPLVPAKQDLAPGAKVWLATRITFPAPESSGCAGDDAQNVRGRLERAGFTGNLDGYRRPPVAKDYLYGPELMVSGVSVDGSRLELSRTFANFVDVTLGLEVGSCPYLLSWEPESQRWVNQGKVLHKGRGAGAKYSEEVRFAGFRWLFKIVEREPEIAHIDEAVLAITLGDGEQRYVMPNLSALGSADGEEVRLLWGDSAEVAFALPPDVLAEDVVDSRLRVTGYYERYGSQAGR